MYTTTRVIGFNNSSSSTFRYCARRPSNSRLIKPLLLSTPYRFNSSLNQSVRSNNKPQSYGNSSNIRSASRNLLTAKRSFTSFRNARSGASSWTQSNSDGIKDSLFRYTISVAFEPKNRRGEKDTPDDENNDNTNNNDNSNKNNKRSGVKPEDEDDNLHDEELDGHEDGTMIKRLKKMAWSSSASAVASSSSLDSPTGEDNYIMGINQSIGGSVIGGVADGVAGWAEHGYNSSAISRELCTNITEAFMDLSQLPTEPEELKNLTRDLLIQAYNKIVKERKVYVGSTTICFGLIDNLTNKLYALNLGDSGVGVYRLNKQDHNKYQCVFKSSEQTHYFNAPYQLSIIPRHIIEEGEQRKAKFLMDEPKDAQLYEFQLEKGDIVMFATDGVSDNVDERDLEIYFTDAFDSTCREGYLQLDKPQQLGQVNTQMVEKVRDLSLDTEFASVFSQNVTRLTGQNFFGGKPDDITCTLIYVD